MWKSIMRHRVRRHRTIRWKLWHEDGCDIICVNLVDRTDPTTVIDLAEKNDILVIFFNRELVEEDLERWDKLYYVGAKAFESGMMEGQIAAAAFFTGSIGRQKSGRSLSVCCA